MSELQEPLKQIEDGMPLKRSIYFIMALPIIGILLSLVVMVADFKMVWIYGILVQSYFLFSLYRYSKTLK